MNFKEIAKSNVVIRSLGKAINIYCAFYNDAKFFVKNYLESAERHDDYRFSIMLLVHSLEKGMCMPNPRFFGTNKVNELISILNKCTPKDSFEYSIGLSILNEWVLFCEKHDWKDSEIYNKANNFLSDKNINLKVGCKKYNPPLSLDRVGYEHIISSRHSVRDFKNEEIKKEDIEFAVKRFLDTPTACNRQMCRIFYVKDKDIKEKLDKIIIGLPGFNLETVNYFIITYDIAAFAYSGERQQGLFNAGLCTCNFINALHVCGIGSCCLQWSNKYSEEKSVSNFLGLLESERIAVVVGCGYYLNDNIIPCSQRKRINDIFSTR